MTLLGCWGHYPRRGFDEALKSMPKSTSSAGMAVKDGLEFCNQLFDIERELKDKTVDERYDKRPVLSRLLLDAFKSWLGTALPKNLFGKAVAYCQNQCNKLTRGLDDNLLEIGNNRSERSINPFIIGRKNWLFSNTPRGDKASAIV